MFLMHLPLSLAASMAYLLGAFQLGLSDRVHTAFYHMLGSFFHILAGAIEVADSGRVGAYHLLSQFVTDSAIFSTIGLPNCFPFVSIFDRLVNDLPYWHR